MQLSPLSTRVAPLFLLLSHCGSEPPDLWSVEADVSAIVGGVADPAEIGMRVHPAQQAALGALLVGTDVAANTTSELFCGDVDSSGQCRHDCRGVGICFDIVAASGDHPWVA